MLQLRPKPKLEVCRHFPLPKHSPALCVSFHLPSLQCRAVPGQCGFFRGPPLKDDHGALWPFGALGYGDAPICTEEDQGLTGHTQRAAMLAAEAVVESYIPVV